MTTYNNATNNATPSVAAHSLLISEGLSNYAGLLLTAGQIPIGTTSSDPVGATLTAGAGITINSVTGAITISTTGGGLTWSTITAATLAAVIDNGYVLNHAATPCVVTLPATAAVGSQMRFNGLAGSGGWTVTANTGQTIQFGNQSSSSAGSWSSSDPGDSCLITCLVANLTWGLSDCVSSGLIKV